MLGWIDGRFTLDRLDGSASGRCYDADRLQTVDSCDGRPLLARYDLAAAARTLTLDTLAARRSGGLWRWAEILPVRCAANVVFLGEGGTPLVAVPRLRQALGAPRLAVEVEGLDPTGSLEA